MCEVIRQFRGKYCGLSSFSECEVRMGGIYYPSIEHAYQAAKTLNKNERELFLNKDVTAGRAKRLGKTVTMREDWDSIKISIMRELCRQKYSQPFYRDLLLSTGDRLIEEGNNWGDRFWGVDLQSGDGNNHLGKILMTLRAEILSPPKKFNLGQNKKGV